MTSTILTILLTIAIIALTIIAMKLGSAHHTIQELKLPNTLKRGIEVLDLIGQAMDHMNHSELDRKKQEHLRQTLKHALENQNDNRSKP